ncbi:RNA-binding S4 domain-containing protein [Pseudotabrizicola formosa]|uniref:RNA-binding S4 domain-containing protein n=1 Tax=Pseudotabrizicola formosa TaxID=2030009 RepID=UPI000CD1AE07|nr:RNA-binding S4 domain-containing protein [Pseudotabrizicola formosa]
MAGPGAKPAPDARPRLRLDKWLWQARFFKSRGLSAEVIESGHCRVNGQRTKKPGHGICIGDVLTFVQGQQVRVIKVQALGLRRGPAAEAQSLYLDLDPPPLPEALE